MKQSKWGSKLALFFPLLISLFFHFQKETPPYVPLLPGASATPQVNIEPVQGGRGERIEDGEIPGTPQ